MKTAALGYVAKVLAGGALLAGLAGIGGAGSAQAAMIPIVNPGFDAGGAPPDTLTLYYTQSTGFNNPPGVSTSASLRTTGDVFVQYIDAPGWEAGWGGVMYNVAPGAPGNNFMHVESTVKQLLPYPFAAGTYVLSAKVGYTSIFGPASPDLSFKYYNTGDSTFYTLTPSDSSTPLIPAANTWVTWTRTYTLTETDAAIGWLPQIFGGGSGVSAFDDFTLDFTPVPEPASGLLLALAGAAMLRRRRGRA